MSYVNDAQMPQTTRYLSTAFGLSLWSFPSMSSAKGWLLPAFGQLCSKSCFVTWEKISILLGKNLIGKRSRYFFTDFFCSQTLVLWLPICMCTWERSHVYMREKAEEVKVKYYHIRPQIRKELSIKTFSTLFLSIAFCRRISWGSLDQALEQGLNFLKPP